MWIGYFEEFPDYLTQGESLSELEENLRDIYRDLTSGQIPGVRSVAELAVGSSVQTSFAESRPKVVFSSAMEASTIGIAIR